MVLVAGNPLVLAPDVLKWDLTVSIKTGGSIVFRRGPVCGYVQGCDNYGTGLHFR